MTTLERFEQFYASINEDTIKCLPEIYAGHVRFVDPVAQHNGLSELVEYFERLMANTQSCTCTIHSMLEQQDKVMLDWTMQFAHPRLNGGNLVNVDGVTVLKLEQDRIVYHRDYYDMGQMIYEQVPLLGAVIKGVKKRMAQ